MPSITGLTAAEVEARRAAGQTNQPPKSQTKTTGEIVRDNVCTYFNLVFLVLAVMLALVHSWLNMGFLGIVFWYSRTRCPEIPYSARNARAPA